ncbi:MAG: F0F1 ATP synthase subunit epsilon [Pirellulaceae bacterium]
MSQLTCIVVTPEVTAVETKADFVALPLFDGEIGLAANHAPMIGRLGFGEMRVKIGEKVTRYYLDGGFVQVSGNVVSVLTNRAVPADQVDAEAAQLQLNNARTLPVQTPEQEEIRDRALAQARGQLRVARRG